MKRNRNLLAVLSLLAVPSMAQANAGTPLMWAEMLHLVFGNFLVGFVEGSLLAAVFALSKKKCIGLLVLANYLSAWLGGLVIAGGISRALPFGLHNAWPLFWLMVAVTYVITLALEFPFVALAFRGDLSWFRKALRGSFLVQTVSYVLLFGWYWLASGTSLYTKAEVVELSSVSLPGQVLMYFISADDGDVYGGSLTDAEWRRVFDLNSTHSNDRLLVRHSTQDSSSWDLIARLESEGQRRANVITVEERFASVAAPSWDSLNKEIPNYVGTGFNFGRVPKLGDAASSAWEFWSGFWPSKGLSGTEMKSGKRVSVSLATPFLKLFVRNATHLPGDKVLFQLGEDQICVYDPEKRQIALLAQGRGPIAVGKEENSNKVNDRQEE